MKKRIGLVLLLLIPVFAVVGFLSGAIGTSVFSGLDMPAWLVTTRPEPELPAEVIFNIGALPVTNTIIGSWITMVLLIGLSYAATRRMKLIPSGVQNFMEAALGYLLNFCQKTAGEKNGRHFFPVIATIFLFVIANAWLALLPGFTSIMFTNSEGHVVELIRGANTDMNTALALAIVSFVFVEYYGFKLGGKQYITKFLNFGEFFSGMKKIFKGDVGGGFSSLLTGIARIFAGVLETIGEFTRMISFTFRLFGNMIAGEILIMVVFFLVPWVVPLPFYALEVLVGYIQALIFAGLSLIFAAVAVAHGHEEECPVSESAEIAQA